MSGVSIGRGKSGRRKAGAVHRRSISQLVAEGSQRKVYEYLEVYYDENDEIIQSSHPGVQDDTNDDERQKACEQMEIAETLGRPCTEDCVQFDKNTVEDQQHDNRKNESDKLAQKETNVQSETPPVSYTEDIQTKRNNNLVDSIAKLQMQIEELLKQSTRNHSELRTELADMKSDLVNEQLKVCEMQTENRELRQRNALCEGMILCQGVEIERNKEAILDIKCRQMRDNVVLSGILEENETDTELFDKVAHFLKIELKMKIKREW